MPEKPDYGEMETRDLPWIVHMITEAPFNCHTHGLKELGSPVEVSMDAHDPALSPAVAQMLNDVGRYVASTGAILEDGQVMKLGPIPLHFHAGKCPAHPDDPTFIHLAGIVPQCEGCAAEGEAPSTDSKFTVLFVVQNTDELAAFSVGVADTTPEKVYDAFRQQADGDYDVSDIYDIFVVDGDLTSVGREYISGCGEDA